MIPKCAFRSWSDHRANERNFKVCRSEIKKEIPFISFCSKIMFLFRNFEEDMGREKMTERWEREKERETLLKRVSTWTSPHAERTQVHIYLNMKLWQYTSLEGRYRRHAGIMCMGWQHICARINASCKYNYPGSFCHIIPQWYIWLLSIIKESANRGQQSNQRN